MKTRSTAFLLLFFSLLFTACGSDGPASQIACMDAQVAADIDMAVVQFEDMLAERYPRVSSAKERWFSYIEDISRLNVDMDQFNNQEVVDLLNQMHASGTFDKLFVLYREEDLFDDLVVDFADDVDYEMPAIPEYYILDTNSETYQCLIESSESEELKQFYREVGESNNLSFVIILSALTNIIERDGLNNEQLHVWIALKVYLELAVQITYEGVPES